MQRLVVYNSNTGFTKRYAEWIAESLGCETEELKKVNEEMIISYDEIIFGGWLMGNNIMGKNDILKLNPKKMVLFAVGGTEPSEKHETDVKELNQICDIPLFYMWGGFNMKKLNFMQRLMIKMVAKVKESHDYTDRKYIEPLVEYCTNE